MQIKEWDEKIIKMKRVRKKDKDCEENDAIVKRESDRRGDKDKN